MKNLKAIKIPFSGFLSVSVLLILTAFIAYFSGLYSLNPNFDILISAVSGVLLFFLGYFITSFFKELKTREDCQFAVTSSFFISGTAVLFRELFEFFADFFFGTNLAEVEFVEDDHWFFSLFGLGKAVYEQRPLYDTGEDMLISFLSSGLSALALYFFLIKKHKDFFNKKKEKLSLSFKAISEIISNKIYFEAEKIRNDTSIWDILIWWMGRAAFAEAIIKMEPNFERGKVIACLIGSFGVSFLHFLFPRDSLFCRISYKVQTIVTALCFIGIYTGSYVGIYQIVGRFDLFLHFISGFFAVLGSYYVATIYVKADSKKNIALIVLYCFSFSCFVIPLWEITEFLGDFLFGSYNQGFTWGPTEESFFFKVFGTGKGNSGLYPIFDTVYDALLAFVTTFASTIWIYIYLRLKLKKKASIFSAEEKTTVKC